MDWAVLRSLSTLPSLRHLSLHYYEGRGNVGSRVGRGVGGSGRRLGPEAMALPRRQG